MSSRHALQLDALQALSARHHRELRHARDGSVPAVPEAYLQGLGGDARAARAGGVWSLQTPFKRRLTVRGHAGVADEEAPPSVAAISRRSVRRDTLVAGTTSAWSGAGIVQEEDCLGPRKGKLFSPKPTRRRPSFSSQAPPPTFQFSVFSAPPPLSLPVVARLRAMLYVVGLGLGDEKDITVNGLEAVKKCERVYLEAYTSILGVPKERLEAAFRTRGSGGGPRVCRAGHRRHAQRGADHGRGVPGRGRRVRRHDAQRPGVACQGARVQGEAHLQREHHERRRGVRAAALPLRPGGVRGVLHRDLAAGLVLRPHSGKRAAGAARSCCWTSGSRSRASRRCAAGRRSTSRRASCRARRARAR